MLQLHFSLSPICTCNYCKFQLFHILFWSFYFLFYANATSEKHQKQIQFILNVYKQRRRRCLQLQNENYVQLLIASAIVIQILELRVFCNFNSPLYTTESTQSKESHIWEVNEDSVILNFSIAKKSFMQTELDSSIEFFSKNNTEASTKNIKNFWKNDTHYWYYSGCHVVTWALGRDLCRLNGGIFSISSRLRKTTRLFLTLILITFRFSTFFASSFHVVECE